MNILQVCNEVNELNPLVKVLYMLAVRDIKKLGVVPCLVETYRPQERQNYLYCQGRTIEDCIKKGIRKDFARKYCNQSARTVTWTLNSIHTQKKAVDLVPQRVVNGKMTAIWNARDIQTKIIIETMQKYGFEAGANWTVNADSPHFQIDGDFDNVFMQGKNTKYATKIIQKALNLKLNDTLIIDGNWGIKTTAAVNKFRGLNGLIQNGKLEASALKILIG